jgi:hypothetical protein
MKKKIEEFEEHWAIDEGIKLDIKIRNAFAVAFFLIVLMFVLTIIRC